MNSLFGEIWEPTTRALIDDEVNYTERERENLVLNGSLDVPEIIETLLFVDSKHIKSILDVDILSNIRPVCEVINAGIEIYQIRNNNYIVNLKGTNNFCPAEIAELFESWLRLAQKIYVITSDSIGNYQNIGLENKPPSMLRFLSNDHSSTYSCPKLEPPNLVSGLGAGILSFSIHLGLKCTLFINYFDMLPLDSVSTGPLINLFNELGFTLKTGQFKMSIPSNNLYM